MKKYLKYLKYLIPAIILFALGLWIGWVDKQPTPEQEAIYRAGMRGVGY